MANDVILKGSSNFRSRGRLPVLSYLHSNGASICRCSQPLSGLSARSLEDEQILQLILETNKSSKYMYVVDTRPKVITFFLPYLFSLGGLFSPENFI
jgi:myotubularin-related protein 6/7/8